LRLGHDSCGRRTGSMAEIPAAQTDAAGHGGYLWGQDRPRRSDRACRQSHLFVRRLAAHCQKALSEVPMSTHDALMALGKDLQQRRNDAWEDGDHETVLTLERRLWNVSGLLGEREHRRRAREDEMRRRTADPYSDYY